GLGCFFLFCFFIVHDMFLKLRSAGIEPESFNNILDFGCGCGRMIRHVKVLKSAKLFGCDYNSELIDWCKNNLHFAEFYKNELLPPLKYADNSMDFIYARSIFTHLDEATQKAWMAEFQRVLKRGGILYFTTHGEQFLKHLKNDEIGRMRKGELIVHLSQREGENFCAAYQLPHFLKANLPEGLELVQFFGGLAEEHLRQDINIVRKL
ncbi:MAG: class I SAM-dependent methyltransferase, partial [Bacteroidota bacterium]